MSILLRNSLQEYLQNPALNNVVGQLIRTNNPQKIAENIQAIIHQYCAQEVSDLIFLKASVGVVMGLQLNNNQKIIFKFYNQYCTKNYLDKMNRIQQLFYEAKFPAPQVLSPIFKFQNTYAGIYEFINGQNENAHERVIRTELARYLAKFAEIVDQHDFELIYTFMLPLKKNQLWPPSHNVLYDFKKSQKGAGWLAKRALRARKLINAANLPKKLAHTDWDIRNVIFREKKLVGVFDWDALGALSEPEMVGRACAKFTADWQSGNRITPTPNEARAFVKAYEQYRGRKFTPEEYAIISATADYFIATIARFEHAATFPCPHPFQDLIKQHGKKSFLYA